MEEPVSSRRSSPVSLLDLGTVVVILAWLAVACYAITYLTSR
jgi:hypothetical protein